MTPVAGTVKTGGNAKPSRRYVTIAEAASLCGVCRRTIYNWMTEGLLEVTYTPTGAVRIDQTKLLTRYARRRAAPVKQSLPVKSS